MHAILKYELARYKMLWEIAILTFVFLIEMVYFEVAYTTMNYSRDTVRSHLGHFQENI